MATPKKLWQNRKEKKEWARRLQSEDPGLEVVHPHAAGINVGNSAIMWRYVPTGMHNRCADSSVYCALVPLADWLKSCGVWQSVSPAASKILKSAVQIS